VLPACPGESVAHGELVRLLRRGGGGGAPRAGDAHVALLLREGCLVRATRPGAGGAGGGGEVYDFALPCVGPAVRAVRAGREELLGVLRRRRGGEAPEAALARVRLRASPLGVRFHVRDLLGSGALLRVHTPAGPMLRVARRG
jgi:serine/threonine-protein kinase 19